MKSLYKGLSFVQLVEKYWGEHASNMKFMTLNETSKAFNMTPRTFARQLHKENKTFKQICQSVRGDMVERWLSNTDYSIGEIAYRAGFQNSNSFHRFFKQLKGQTPSDFRDVCNQNKSELK